ncbi:MAG: pilus assembly protein [Chloroflexi bacterium]|nr:MAG: pilus assembly protein [Chloroflexota bacterium]
MEARIHKSPLRQARGLLTCRFITQVRGKSRGQSLVEAAITLPIVLLLALGVTDIGRSFFYREAVTNSVRQSLRIAVSSYQQTTANTVCASTSGGPVAITVTSAVPPSGGQVVTIANQAALESSKDGTPAGSAIAGATLTVTFHCLNGVAITNATGNGNGPSDPGSDSITATITQPMSVVTPLLWPIIGSSFPIRITSSQRVEY